MYRLYYLVKVMETLDLTGFMEEKLLYMLDGFWDLGR